VLVYYVNIINNARNVDISPELGAVAVPEVPRDQAGGLSLR
jgi:hypothetical protein